MVRKISARSMLMRRVADLRTQIARLEKALLEINEGAGEYSYDRLEHAENTIKAMKRKARTALYGDKDDS